MRSCVLGDPDLTVGAIGILKSSIGGAMNVKLSCSAGRGTEKYLKNEIINLLSLSLVNQVDVLDGRVRFEVLVKSRKEFLRVRHNLFSLKSAERLFFEILYKDGVVVTAEDIHHALEESIECKQLWYDIAWWSITSGEEDEHEENNSNKTNTLDTDLEAATELMSDVNDGDEVQDIKKLKSCSDTEGPVERNFTQFRINCKCPQQLQYSIGNVKFWTRKLARKVKSNLGWEINLRKPLVEINLNIRNDSIWIGVPMLSRPLASRPYYSHFGLRSTIAWCMCVEADLQFADVIFDPFCGSASILCEAIHSWPNIVTIGADLNGKQLDRARLNLPNIDVLASDALQSILKNCSVDKIISDIPFGVQHASVSSLSTMSASMSRILRPTGKIVLLVGEDQKMDVIDAFEKISFICRKTNYFKLGETNAFLCVFSP